MSANENLQATNSQNEVHTVKIHAPIDTADHYSPQHSNHTEPIEGHPAGVNDQGNTNLNSNSHRFSNDTQEIADPAESCGVKNVAKSSPINRSDTLSFWGSVFSLSVDENNLTLNK